MLIVNRNKYIDIMKSVNLRVGIWVFLAAFAVTILAETREGLAEDEFQKGISPSGGMTASNLQSAQDKSQTNVDKHNFLIGNVDDGADGPTRQDVYNINNPPGSYELDMSADGVSEVVTTDDKYGNDQKIDTWWIWDFEREMVLLEVDTNGDGIQDRWVSRELLQDDNGDYKTGIVRFKSNLFDSNHDGSFDARQTFFLTSDGTYISEVDTNLDGQVDQKGVVKMSDDGGFTWEVDTDLDGDIDERYVYDSNGEVISEEAV